MNHCAQVQSMYLTAVTTGAIAFQDGRVSPTLIPLAISVHAQKLLKIGEMGMLQHLESAVPIVS